MQISFVKMNGAGNDFVMLDNRQETYSNIFLKNLAVKMCHRHFGVGADGLIVIEVSKKADFKMRIINADGSEAEMCGNGARCAALFAKNLGIVSGHMTFETLAGVIEADVTPQGLVRVKMSDPKDFQWNMSVEEKGRLWDVSFVNTGVPHAIVFVQDLDKVDVVRLGRLIRFHALFAPAGTNVNVVQVEGPSTIRVRTYERGVEDETFACGTGATAAALLAHQVHGVASPVQVKVKGGELSIAFQTSAAKQVKDVSMEGGADVVFKGEYTYV